MHLPTPSLLLAPCPLWVLAHVGSAARGDLRALFWITHRCLSLAAAGQTHTPSSPRTDTRCKMGCTWEGSCSCRHTGVGSGSCADRPHESGSCMPLLGSPSFPSTMLCGQGHGPVCSPPVLLMSVTATLSSSWAPSSSPWLSSHIYSCSAEALVKAPLAGRHCLCLCNGGAAGQWGTCASPGGGSSPCQCQPHKVGFRSDSLTRPAAAGAVTGTTPLGLGTRFP